MKLTRGEEDVSKKKSEGSKDQTNKNLDKGKEIEPKETDKGKGKEIEQEEETFESKYKGTFMQQYHLSMLQKLEALESRFVREEREVYDKTGFMPEESYNDKVGEFRKKDQQDINALLKDMNINRLKESPNDIGESSKKRSFSGDDSEDDSEKK